MFSELHNARGSGWHSTYLTPISDAVPTFGCKLLCMIVLSLLVAGIINLLWVSAWTKTILNELVPRAFEEPPRNPASRFPGLASVLLVASLIQLVGLAYYGITGNPFHTQHEWTRRLGDFMFPLAGGLVFTLTVLVCRVFYQFGKIAQYYDFKQSSLIYKFGMERLEAHIDPEDREQILSKRRSESH